MSNFMTRWLKISLVVIMGCGFLAMMIYALINRDEISSSQIEPPLITAPAEPLKRRPDQPGGLQIPNRDKLVFDLLDSSNTTLGETGVTGSNQVVVSASDVVSSENAAVARAVEAVPATEVKQVASVPVPAVVAPVPVAPKPVEAKVVESKPVEPKPVEKAESKQESKIEKSANGKWAVQLAAVNTKADGDAMAAKASKDFPALRGLTAKVSPVPGAKKYRVQFIGLKDRDAAASVCAKLAGKQGCFPVGAN